MEYPSASSLNNYDVIVQRTSNDKPLRLASGNYIGNRRFWIILESMFRQSYLQAELFGDEDDMEAIAMEVVDTISNKVRPAGRFFLQRDHDGDGMQQLEYTSSNILRMVHNSLQKYPIGEPYCAVIDRYISSPSTKDCVCTARGISLNNRYTGNNRIRVIFSMRENEYKSSTIERKRLIVEEVVTSIIDDAASSFLQKDRQSGYYKILTRTDACKCIKKALDYTISDEKKKKHQEARATKKDVVQPQERKVPFFEKLERRRLVSSSPCTTFNNVPILERNSVTSRAA